MAMFYACYNTATDASDAKIMALHTLVFGADSRPLDFEFDPDQHDRIEDLLEVEAGRCTMFWGYLKDEQRMVCWIDDTCDGWKSLETMPRERAIEVAKDFRNAYIGD